MEHDDLEKMDKELRDKATPEELELDKYISRNRHTIFTATYKGEEVRVVAVEHNNIGPGWMMQQWASPQEGMIKKGQLHGPIISSSELENVQAWEAKAE